MAWDGFEFHLGPQAFAGVFPTHGGEASVWLIQPSAAAGPVLSAGADRGQAWLHALRETAPCLAERVAGGRVADRVRGAVGLPNLVAQASGPGWALIGDAGYHRDPITGHGMTDAFRDAELLAQAADEALLHRRSETTAMAPYDLRRREALRESFRITLELGRFPDPHRFTALQIELAQVLEQEAIEFAALPAMRGGIAMATC